MSSQLQYLFFLHTFLSHFSFHSGAPKHLTGSSILSWLALKAIEMAAVASNECWAGVPTHLSTARHSPRGPGGSCPSSARHYFSMGLHWTRAYAGWVVSGWVVGSFGLDPKIVKDRKYIHKITITKYPKKSQNIKKKPPNKLKHTHKQNSSSSMFLCCVYGKIQNEFWTIVLWGGVRGPLKEATRFAKTTNVGGGRDFKHL